MARRDVPLTDARRASLLAIYARAHGRGRVTSLWVLGSGSAGNCCAVEADGATVLIDAGFSAKEVERRAERVALDLSGLSAIVLTHEHGDHAAGAARLARRFRVPVVTAAGTWASIRRTMRGAEHRELGLCARVEIGPFAVEACPTSHDAAEPLAVVVRDGRRHGRRRGVRSRTCNGGGALSAARPHGGGARGEPRRRAAPDQRVSAVGAAPDRGVRRASVEPGGGRVAGGIASSRTRGRGARASQPALQHPRRRSGHGGGGAPADGIHGRTACRRTGRPAGPAGGASTGRRAARLSRSSGRIPRRHTATRPAPPRSRCAAAALQPPAPLPKTPGSARARGRSRSGGATTRSRSRSRPAPRWRPHPRSPGAARRSRAGKATGS